MNRNPMDDDFDLFVDLEDDTTPAGVPKDKEDIAEQPERQTPAYDVPDDLNDDEADAEQNPSNDRPGQKPENDGSDEDHVIESRRALAEERERSARREANSVFREAEFEMRDLDAHAQNAVLALNNLEIYMRDAMRDLAQAKDAGNTVLELEIERKVREMEGLRAQLREGHSQVADHKRQIQNRARQKADSIISEARRLSFDAGSKIADDVVAKTPLASKWAKQNPWMTSNKDARDFVVRKGEQLSSEGWDMATPGFYAELSRQVERAFPGIKSTPIQAQKQAPRAQSNQVKSPIAPGRSSGGVTATMQKPAGQQTRYTLTSADQGAMRRMNLDPSNPNHRKHFAKARLQSARRAVQ